MFKFGFGFRRAKRGLRVSKGVYIRQEHELEKSVGMPDWVRDTASGVGVGEVNYSRYTQMFPASPWQPGMTWEATDDIKQFPSSNYYDS